MISWNIIFIVMVLALACAGGAGCLLPLAFFILVGIFLNLGFWGGMAVLAGAFIAFLIAVHFKT